MQGSLSAGGKHFWLAGAVCLVAMQTLVIGTRYELQDADSTLYAAIAGELSAQPVERWIAPNWPQGRGAGLFAEHPAVFFWPSAALLRAGLQQAPLFVNFACWLLTLHFLHALARTLAGRTAATFAVACCAFSPLFVQYLLRANHETPLALATTGAFAAIADVRVSHRRTRIVAFVVLAFAVKGVLGCVLLLALALFALWRGDRAALGPLAVGAAASLSIAATYEAFYQHVTRESFLLAYLGAQLGRIHSELQRDWLHVLWSPSYYVAYWFWLTLPSSALVLPAIWRRRAPTEARSLGLTAAASYVGLLSFFARRAARYAVPAYVLCHVSGGEEIARSGRLRAFALRHRSGLPYALLAWVFLLAAVRTWFDPRYFRFINPF